MHERGLVCAKLWMGFKIRAINVKRVIAALSEELLSSTIMSNCRDFIINYQNIMRNNPELLSREIVSVEIFVVYTDIAYAA